MRRTLSFLAAGLLFGCGAAPLPLIPEEGSPVALAAHRIDDLAAAEQNHAEFPFRRILCFGDSITFGVTLRAAPSGMTRSALTLVEGYVPKLSRLLAREFGDGIDLINSGIGGESSSEGLERFDGEIHLFRPDLILLLEGIVDVNTDNPRFPVVRSNLAEMMRLAQLRRVPIVIGTYPRLNPEGFRVTGAVHIPRLNDVIRQEANRKQVPIADHERAFGGDFRGQGPDGLHPNDIGYEIMAETWFTAIQSLVEGVSEAS